MSLDRKIKKSNIFYELSENFDYINSNSFERNINYSKNEISQYQIKGKIGEGMFGKVKLGIHLLTNEKVAIKIFDKGKIKNEKEVEYIEREISILKKLNHYNTIKLYNIIQNENFIFLIQEYVPNGELLHFLENPENMNLTENHICKIYQQIISGIEYLHDIGIAHRDLKLENILLNRDKNIKIIDFGLSNKYNKENGELLQSSCGSPCYAAPEMIKGIQYHGLDTDIWSSGILLYLMLCKSFPFNDKNNSKLYQKILSGKFNLPNYLSNEAKDLLSKLLKVNPIERIKLDEIKKHPWFNLYNPKNNYFYGIDINKIIMPIDEEIIIDMINIGIEPNIVIDNIIRNCNNNITTIYYLLLQKKIKKGKKSIADFCSNFYMDYINDEKNKFIYFNNDIDLVIQSRIKNINKNSKNIRQIKLMNSENGINKPLNNKNKNLKNNYFFIKINPKILKTKNENCNNRQTTERQNLKNILLNFPTKSHTIDHMSKSNSKRKKILKSPNLTRFNTRKYLKNIQNNINTIENKRHINMIYNNRVKPNFKIKKNDCLYSRLLNKRKINDTSGNKNGNSNNFRMLIYNKSVDNKYSKEKYKGINNYMNYNFWKINNIREIRKKIYRTIEIKNRIDSQNSYSPMITHNNEQKYQDNSLLIKSINGYGNISKNGINKNIIKLKKKKEEKMNISNINRSKMNNSNQNYYIINKNKNNIKRKSKNSYGINNNGINNLKLKNNNKLLSLSQQKDKKEKKTKVKKASSFSIDLNFKNNQKIEYNIYTNRPKRKNVMKFVNKNNMNLKFGDLYNKYEYCYRNENKKNMNNKSLDLQN